MMCARRVACRHKPTRIQAVRLASPGGGTIRVKGLVLVLEVQRLVLQMPSRLMLIMDLG